MGFLPECKCTFQRNTKSKTHLGISPSTWTWVSPGERAVGVKEQIHARDRIKSKSRPGPFRSNVRLRQPHAHDPPVSELRPPCFGESLVLPQLQSQELPLSPRPTTGHREWSRLERWPHHGNGTFPRTSWCEQGREQPFPLRLSCSEPL